MERETVGKISLDLLKNSVDDTHSAFDQMREQLSEFDKNIHDCIATMKKSHPSKDFYVVVLTKRERLTPNVFRNYFLARLSCPTPTYDQATYFYSNKDDYLEFMWVIPTRDVCIEFVRAPALTAPDEMRLLKCILDFADGSLFRLAQRRNGEIFLGV